MQKENTEFDLLVRSMMQDAEEPVSPRVWEAVSAGLGPGTRRPVVIRLRRAAAGIAAAAAVAVGAILLGTRDNSNLPHHIDTVAQVLAVPESGPAAEAAESPETPETTMRTATPAEPAAPAHRQAAAPAVPAAAESPLPEESAVQGPGKPEAGQPQESVPGEVLPLPDERTALTDEVFEDPFARMEWEDSRQDDGGVRISLSAGGIMQSNGNPSAISGFRGMRAAANKDLDHTVIEQVSRDATYAIPVSAGLGLRIGLGERWAVGTGVNWTLLQRTFSGIYREDGAVRYNGDIHHTLQYIGIPLNLSYSLVDNRRIGVYAFGGGTVEKALSNKFTANENALSHTESVDGFQWSAAAGFGVQFQLTDFLGLYIDPSLRYYFKGNQPTSIRTQQPLMMNFEIGLRWDL